MRELVFCEAVSVTCTLGRRVAVFFFIVLSLKGLHRPVTHHSYILLLLHHHTTPQHHNNRNNRQQQATTATGNNKQAAVVIWAPN